jgi:hypothetical protein
VTPAFSSTRRAAAFALLLALLLLAPALGAWFRMPDAARAYATIPTSAGPYAHMRREIFLERDELDIAFIGSSFMWSAIDGPMLRDSLSAALGRPVRLTTLASVWPGLDRDYTVLRDLLEHRRVRMVVLQLPNRDRPTDDPHATVNRVTDEPHLRASRFYRVGAFPGMTEGLPWRSRLGLYASAVVGFPRHLLSLARPDQVRPFGVEGTLGARLDERGYYGARYQRFRPDPPVLTAGDILHRSCEPPACRVYDEPLPPYQAHFVARMSALLRERHVPAVLLHVPQANERDATAIEERADWFAAFGPGTTLIGVPPARLFAGLRDDEIKRLYVSDHFNANGAVFFTRAILPGLLRRYRETAR